jgi:translocon-associated protein subunit beta
LTSLLVLLVLLCGCCATDSSESAHLLVSKRVLNEYVVEGRDLTVSYAIYNVGSSPATEVSLVEETFTSDDFQIVSGQFSVRWQSIAPYPFCLL